MWLVYWYYEIHSLTIFNKNYKMKAMDIIKKMFFSESIINLFLTILLSYIIKGTTKKSNAAIAPADIAVIPETREVTSPKVPPDNTAAKAIGKTLPV